MRNLRWAAELAVESDIRKAGLGFAQLKALGGSDMLNGAEQLFVDSALESVVREPLDDVQRDAARLIIKRAEARGETVSSTVRMIAEAQPYNPDEDTTSDEPSPRA